VTHLIHDDYYKGKKNDWLIFSRFTHLDRFAHLLSTDLQHKSVEERAQHNFDHPDSLETDLLLEHIQTLKKGEPVQSPIYDFTTHTRTSKTVEKIPRPIILVEGILLFTHSKLVQELDVKVFVDCDSDIRLTRRIQRDISERGRTVDDVIRQYHETVRPMHEEFVEPSKRSADLIVHSSGHSMDVSIRILVNHLRTETGITSG